MLRTAGNDRPVRSAISRSGRPPAYSSAQRASLQSTETRLNVATQRRTALDIPSSHPQRFSSNSFQLGPRSIEGIQSLTDAILAWSGWVFGLFSAIVTADSIRRANVERRRSQRMAKALSTPGPTRPALSVSSQRLASEAQLRAFLVHAAAGHQRLGAVIGRGKSIGVDEADVMSMTKDLRRSGLLDYHGDLGPTTTLNLKG